MQLKALLAFCALASPSLGLGINCRGSGRCAECSGALEKIARILEVSIHDGNGNGHYATGRPIACTWTCCAFFQNGASGTPKQALAHIRTLQAHGCKTCGSNPTQPGNNVKDGQLTVNYAFYSKPYCEDGRICPTEPPGPDGTEEEQAKASVKAAECRMQPLTGDEDACDD